MAGKDDDTDLDESALGERGARAFAQHMAQANEDEDTLEVQDEEEPEETETAPSRQDRRSQRGSARASARERAAVAEAEAKLLREQLEVERTRAAQLPQSQQHAGNPVEHIDREYRATIDAMRALDEQYSRAVSEKRMTPEQEREMQEKWTQLDLKKATLVIERREVLTAPQRTSQARQDALRSRFPDVYGNPKAHQYAAALWNMETARGAAEDDDLHERVMARTREEFLGKRPAPSAASRARASGMSSGARSPGAKVEVRMPRGQELDRMAWAAYPNLDPAQARQKWANRNGKEFLELAKERER